MALYCSPDYKINGLSVQEKKCKIDFLDSSHGDHLGFLIGMILALFSFPSHSDASYQVWSQLAFQFRRREK